DLIFSAAPLSACRVSLGLQPGLSIFVHRRRRAPPPRPLRPLVADPIPREASRARLSLRRRGGQAAGGSSPSSPQPRPCRLSTPACTCCSLPVGASAPRARLSHWLARRILEEHAHPGRIIAALDDLHLSGLNAIHSLTARFVLESNVALKMIAGFHRKNMGLRSLHGQGSLGRRCYFDKFPKLKSAPAFLTGG
ncbi:unnamed protein product, partial [Urochloa humidicola]